VRLPAAPLLAVFERAARAQGYLGREGWGDSHNGMPAFCEMLGLTDAVYYRARREGTITVALADKIACALGLHPVLIWPAEWPVEAPKDDERADRAAERRYQQRQYQAAARRKSYAKRKEFAA
jgi:hypothetical protein